ncbi:hypothetical protein [Alienimonas californiensis]|uniref:Uncharacterized protein n=1 Tax=Alienimonas californiensis TaxID=2527989 RepID=A0A517P4S5_9PLAN|nr:hypothetical protein [Alienimonas californiensis]QDT14379.1 hypothetical protein CA12_04520 [Alienimonas californiensis]
MFDRDGSLRDVLVLETTVDDWERLLDFVRTGPQTYSYSSVDGKADLPAAQEIFPDGQREGLHLMAVNLGGCTANCHFFWTGDIEFDLDPKEVTTAERAAAVFAWMRDLGRELGKPIRLTPENTEEYVLAAYDPATDSFDFRGSAGPFPSP